MLRTSREANTLCRERSAELDGKDGSVLMAYSEGRVDSLIDVLAMLEADAIREPNAVDKAE